MLIANIIVWYACRAGSIITSSQLEVFVPVAALALTAYDYYFSDDYGEFDTYQERIYRVGYITDILNARKIEEFASFSYGTKSGFKLHLNQDDEARPVSEFRAEDIISGLLRYKSEKGRRHYLALRTARLFRLPTSKPAYPEL